MHWTPILLLGLSAALLGVCENHEHAHRHHQQVGRHEHHNGHDQEHVHHKRQLGIVIGGVTIGLPGATKTSTTKSTTKSTTTTRTSSKTTTTSSRTSSKTSTTTTKTTSTAKTSSTTSAKSLSTSSTKTSTTGTSTSSAVTSTTATTSVATTSVSAIANSTLSGTSNSTVSGNSTTVGSTILVIARDQDSINQAVSGLNAYGIPFQTLIVPQSGASLPTLNTSAGGNFGGIVVASGISYYYGDSEGWHSGLTNDQWSQLYAYQLMYGVRMVQFDVYPQPAFGVSVIGSCCNSGVEQTISFTNTTAFKQAGIREGAGMSTIGIFHYLAQLADTSTTTEIAQFAANSQYGSPSTAAVINNFDGREQMVFFISWATSWSATSTYLQHAYITWMTRGLYAGYRRVHLATQIDDVMLRTQIYYPGNSTTFYRLKTDDMEGIKSWTPKIQAKMNPGSWYRVELGHNGNGNVIAVDPDGQTDVCTGGPIYTSYTSTSLEYQKPLGSGTDGWPTKPITYPFTQACMSQDPLYVWMSDPSNRDWFLHISHTFTHEGQNNATYNDIYKEIDWNQQWFAQNGIATGNFSADGLIPPQITGLHNGDALRAWSENGITNAVGDNSRPVLRNQQNQMWPYTTTVAANGFDGITVVPRWAGRIYYNCDTPECTLQEWIDTSGGSGGFSNLMSMEIADATRYLLGLYHDSYMFHQLNMRNQNVTGVTTPDGTQALSLLQIWVENVVQEFTRLVNWPIITLKQTDLAVSFKNRQTRDACAYQMSWSKAGGKITGVTVSSSSNSCSVPIPLTVPGSVTDTKGFTTEQIGNDPLTIWVQLNGQPVSFTLSQPI